MKPLEGVRILDFTQAHAGSLGTMHLADFGAEVIKVERPGSGDLARFWEPIRDGESGYYAYLNRNKKSIAVNGFTPEGKEIIYRLVRDVDVVCENFKYGSMARMGFDYETLKQYNPNLIYASLNGFGQTGILRDNIGLDIHLQAMSGIMDRTGFPGRPPVRVGAAFGDHVSGTYLANAILLALIHRERTGEGQAIDIAILDSLMSILEDGPVLAQFSGNSPGRTGNRYPGMAPYDTIKTKDGYLTLAIGAERQWAALCKALDREDLLQNPAYEDNDARDANYESQLLPELTEIFSAWGAAALEQALTAAGISCSRVCSVSEAIRQEQIEARGVIREVESHGLGKVRYPGPVIRLTETPAEIECGAPARGRHTREVLLAAGFTSEQIQGLVDTGAIEAGSRDGDAEEGLA